MGNLTCLLRRPKNLNFRSSIIMEFLTDKLSFFLSICLVIERFLVKLYNISLFADNEVKLIVRNANSCLHGVVIFDVVSSLLQSLFLSAPLFSGSTYFPLLNTSKALTHFFDFRSTHPKKLTEVV